MRSKKLPQYGDDGELLVEKFCTKCGSVNSANADYCANCNTSFVTLPDISRREFSWFPYRTYSFVIPGSVEDAAAQLADATVYMPLWGGRDYWQRRPKIQGKFAANVSTERFHVTRLVWYIRIFIPFVYGRFKRIRSWTRITVKVTWHPMEWLAWVWWLMLMSLETFNQLTRGSTGFIWAIALFLFPYLLSIAAFNFEANKAEFFLDEVFRPRKNS